MFSAEASGERTRPRVQFPASRRKTLVGETPNTTRGDAYAPGTTRNRGLSVRLSEITCESCANRRRSLREFSPQQADARRRGG